MCVNNRDIQTLAVLSCILEQPGRWSNFTTKPSNADNHHCFQHAFIKSCCRVLFNRVRQHYAEILHRWGFNVPSREINKFIDTPSTHLDAKLSKIGAFPYYVFSLPPLGCIELALTRAIVLRFSTSKDRWRERGAKLRTAVFTLRNMPLANPRHGHGMLHVWPRRPS